MTNVFIEDLDTFFSATYNDYGVISKLKNYSEDQTEYLKRVLTTKDLTYNFATDENKFKICFHKNYKELLEDLKKKISDNNFNFSSTEIPFKTKIKLLFNKELKSGEFLKKILTRYGYTDFFKFNEHINLDKTVWKNILNTSVMPTKRIIQKICLFLGSTIDENLEFFAKSNNLYNYNLIFDVVTRYLIERKVFNTTLINIAFDEYKLTRLF